MCRIAIIKSMRSFVALADAPVEAIKLAESQILMIIYAFVIFRRAWDADAVPGDLDTTAPTMGWRDEHSGFLTMLAANRRSKSRRSEAGVIAQGC
jgi:hypothetical protein